MGEGKNNRMRAGRWLWVGLIAALVVTSCVTKRRRAPRQAPPATVQPLGPPGTPGRPPEPDGRSSAKGFHAGSGGTNLPKGAVHGRPRGMHPGAPPALWIWLNPRGEWRVRSTTGGATHQFKGTVMGESAPLQSVHCARNEMRDQVTLTEGRIDYEFTTSGHIDGFDFRTSERGGCARFALTPGGPSDSYRVFVGRDRRTPASFDFVLCP